MSTVWSKYSSWLSTANSKYDALKVVYQDTSVRLLTYWNEIRANPTWPETSFTFPMYGTGSVMEKLLALETDLHWIVEAVTDATLDVISNFGSTISWVSETLEQTFEDLSHDYEEIRKWFISLEPSWPSFSYELKIEHLGELISMRQSVSDLLTKVEDYLGKIKNFAFLADFWSDTDGVDPEVEITDTNGNVLDLTGDDFWNMMIAMNMTSGYAQFFRAIRDFLNSVPTYTLELKLPKVINSMTAIIPFVANTLSTIFYGVFSRVDYAMTHLGNFFEKTSTDLTNAWNSHNYQSMLIELPSFLIKGVSLGLPSTVMRAGFNLTCVWCRHVLSPTEKNTIMSKWTTMTLDPDEDLLCPECDNSLLDITIAEVTFDWIVNILKVLAVILIVKGLGVLLNAYKSHKNRQYKATVKGNLASVLASVGEDETDVHTKLDSILSSIENMETIIEVLNPDTGFIYLWIRYLSDKRHFSPP